MCQQGPTWAPWMDTKPEQQQTTLDQAVKQSVAMTHWQPVQQEPIGEVFINTGSGVLFAPMKDVRWKDGNMPPEGTKLYDRPPASKPWVELTPAEVHDIWCFNHTPQEVCNALSAKLREKNQ